MNKSQLTFGHKLRELRENKGLTQEQLAERVGITANAVGQFERGKIFPNYETTANIINVLDIDANLLFSRVCKWYTITSRFRQIKSSNYYECIDE